MADVVIQGMEMPKDCSYCKMAYDGAWCLLSEESNDCVEGGMMWRKCPYGGRPSWCPIVPLPEGHGNLIDMDAPVQVKHWTDEATHETTVNRLLSKFNIVEGPNIIIQPEGGNKD